MSALTPNQARLVTSLTLLSISDAGLARLGIDRRLANRASGLAWSRIRARDREGGSMTEPEELFKRRSPLTRFDQIRLSTAPPYLVKGLIPRSGLVVIWGPANSGKSFLIFDLAAHVALGWPYRDQKVNKGTVVYLVLEGEHGIRARVEAFRHRRRPSPKAMGRVFNTFVCVNCNRYMPHRP